MLQWLYHIPREAFIWTVGLLAMASFDPHASAHLISLCPLDALGFSFCPGCGLGHSIAHLARGELLLSWEAHPLGLPAVLVISGRVGTLLVDAYSRSLSD